MQAPRDPDWRTAWLTLTNRLAWQQACAEAERHTLVFDIHDQARLA